MNDIKIKDSGLVGRLPEGSSDLSLKMKRGLSRTKDTVRDLADDGQVTPDEYAEDRIKNISEETAEDAVHDAKEAVDKALGKVKRKVRKKLEDRLNNSEERSRWADYKGKTDHAQIRQRQKNGDSIKQTEKSTGRAKIKTVSHDIKAAGQTTGRAVKTTETTAKTSIKTAEKTAKTAEQTAKAAKKTAEASAKAAKKAAEAAREAAKAAAKAAKVIAKAVVAAVKAIIAEVKELIALIAEGGWVSVIVILIIALFALVLCSAFGVFATNTDTGCKPMSEIISEINTEYYSRIENDVAAIDIGRYDAKKVCYSTDDDGEYPANNWNDVISVFAVMATTDAEDPMDVVILTDISIDYIRNIFYQMNSYDIHTGHEYDEELELEVLVVYVTQHTMTYTEAAAHFNFNARQTEILNEMMTPKYYPYFASLTGIDIYGGADVNSILSALPAGTAGDVVRAALSKLGAPYVRGSRGPNSFDCSGLAWWSINQTDPTLARHFQGCAADQAHYCENMTVDRSELQPGDLVFWHYNECGGCGRWNEIHHIGIYVGQGKVVDASCSKGRVVMRDLWESDSYDIFMFARPYGTL